MLQPCLVTTCNACHARGIFIVSMAPWPACASVQSTSRMCWPVWRRCKPSVYVTLGTLIHAIWCMRCGCLPPCRNPASQELPICRTAPAHLQTRVQSVPPVQYVHHGTRPSSISSIALCTPYRPSTIGRWAPTMSFITLSSKHVPACPGSMPCKPHPRYVLAVHFIYLFCLFFSVFVFYQAPQMSHNTYIRSTNSIDCGCRWVQA